MSVIFDLEREKRESRPLYTPGFSLTGVIKDLRVVNYIIYVVYQTITEGENVADHVIVHQGVRKPCFAETPHQVPVEVACYNLTDDHDIALMIDLPL